MPTPNSDPAKLVIAPSATENVCNAPKEVDEGVSSWKNQLSLMAVPASRNLSDLSDKVSEPAGSRIPSR